MVGFDMHGFPGLSFLFIGLLSLAVWAGGLFVVVYFAARLAIRHERRISN